MGYDEYYKGNEYKGSDEHLLFKLEITNNQEIIFLDENKSSKEDNESLRKNQPTETGKYKKKKIKSKHNSSNQTSTNNDSSITKITSNTASGSIISTTSAVTAGVVVVATISIIAATPPLIDLISLHAGGDYVEYKIETHDFVDGIKYFVEIEGDHNFSYKKAIETPGIYEDLVNNLVPNCNYIYKFVGYDSALDYKVYLNKNFKTSFNFLATYNKLSVEDSQIIWTSNYDEENDVTTDIYRIIVPTKFENNENNNYQYRITLFNNEGLNEQYQGTLPEVVFDIPRTYQTAAIKYESIIIKDGIDVVCDTIITDTYTFTPSFKINEFNIDYTNSYAMVDIEMDAPEDYGLRYYTSLDSNPIEIYASDTAYVNYPEEETTYYFYLVNELGETVSDKLEYKVNLIDKVDYVFNYYNPSNITVTYNNNGSINAYLDTSFSCEDENVYYEIKLLDYEYDAIRYVSQNRYASIENFMMYNGRGLNYKVYKLVDNVKHCFMMVTPSGMFEINQESNINYEIDYSSDPQVLNLNTYNYYKIDTSSAYLMLDGNERFDIPEDAFTINEYDEYVLNIEIPRLIESAELHYMGSVMYNEYDKLKEIEELDMKGNCYTKVVLYL